MNHLPIASLEELNAAVESHNPFSRVAVVSTQTVWGKGFPDLPTLNDRAYQRILEAIQQVKRSNSSINKVASVTITGNVGTGKTQLISRLRRNLMGDGSALFIYANAGKYGDLDSIRSQFQQTLTKELARIGSQEVTQWQEVAAALANASNPSEKKTSAKTLVTKFDKAYTKALNNNHNLIKYLSAKILSTKPDVDPYILRAILWTLSETYNSYAVEWLSGNELDRETAEILGLPTNANKTIQQQEAEALQKIQQILRLVCDYKSILICFDELDPDRVNLGIGLTLPQIIAGLVKNLFDSLEQSSLGQGIVILTAMFESVWRNHIKMWTGTSDSSGAIDRISTLTQGNPLTLELGLNSQSTIDLVEVWLQEDLYAPRNLTPHDSVYPFDRNQLLEIGKSKPTVRELLNWCAENFKVDREKSPVKRFDLALADAKAADLGNYIDENEVIAEVLHFSFEQLIGQTLDGQTSTGEMLNKVTITGIETDIKPVNSHIEPKGLYNSNWIHFKVKGNENGQDFVLGIAVVQQNNAASVGAALKRLMAYERFGLTRGCLVRSKEKTISKKTDAFKLLEQFQEQMGGEWAYLDAEEIRPLLDIYTVYQNCKSHKLTQEQVLEFANQQIFENPLLREILSDPSGVVDEETIAEEEGFEIIFDDSNDDIAFDEDIDDLFDSEG